MRVANVSNDEIMLKKYSLSILYLYIKVIISKNTVPEDSSTNGGPHFLLTRIQSLVKD